MDALGELGLASDAARIGVPIRAMEMHARGRSAAVTVAPGGVALPREEFDCMLMRAAAAAGACVVHGASARLVQNDTNGGTVALKCAGAQIDVCARVVLAADGLGGTFLPHDGVWEPTIWRRSRIGLGARLPACDARLRGFPKPSTVAMFFGRGGYLGMVRLADGSIDAAAAVDPGVVRTSGTPGAAVRAILLASGASNVEIGPEVRWHGTPALTRRRKVESGPVFAVGDSAGYVEPLTGEGMTLAIRGGIAAADHAAAWLAGTARAGDWTCACRGMFRGRRSIGTALALCSRSPQLAAGIVTAMGMLPSLTDMVRGVCAGPWKNRAAAEGVM
jgi:flavin-dependent dehydrogenase